ncbi:hypothetical protein [Thiocystis violacea]|uniref:hypothetical protein n=1 Tax=Thiocystis violacea TaxID=13725 RepID=UPI0019074EED|nr:hypothetical protein [Thiocystis violacea]MBK1724511.1 hypothetical protein [Thiocystis violacea]
MTDETRNQSQIQGEGDRESARRYEADTQRFVESGKVEQAAKDAAEQSPETAKRAEQAGEARAKEKDPALHRDYQKPTTD